MKFFRSILPVLARIIPAPSFTPITYWRHSENEHLYLCMSEKYICTDDKSTAEEKFSGLFPKAIRISQTEFDTILYFDPDMEVVTVADDNILSMIAKEDTFVPDNDGAYAEDEHEESEDQKLTNTD
jgi:hypothetical protein